MPHPNHRGLTADVFVIRRNAFLTLTRIGEIGDGVDYRPGGIVELGETLASSQFEKHRKRPGCGCRTRHC